VGRCAPLTKRRRREDVRLYPKGTYRCTYCSLAIYPVLRARAIRYFDCNALAKNLEHVIRSRQWRFKTPPNAAMLRWALGDD
jgi:hypothetical protein